MKKLFLSLVALVMATMSYAQSKLVATLTHGDKVTMYDGASAFKKAYNAAQSGDVITLSGGSFSGVTISKAVTIRGTGIDETVPTEISSMGINIPENDTCRFSIEGVRIEHGYFYGSCSEPYFIKCKFSEVSFYDGDSYSASSIKDATFVNCKFEKSLTVYGSTTAKLSHCYVHSYSNGGYRNYDPGKAEFLNCIIRGDLNQFRRSSFVNSILIGNDSSTLPGETLAMNCTAFSAEDGVFDYQTVVYFNDEIYAYMQGSEISCSTSTCEEVFKSYRGRYSDSETFELTEDATTKFLGTDDTQIGLYGGKYPYNSTPAYPRITKLNVAKQSTADDKLSVDIEVSAAE